MSKKNQYWDETWNSVSGCSKISAGCKNCYAAAMAPRLKGRFGYDKHDPFDITFHPEQITKPFRWKSSKIIFVCSMGDLFHDRVPDGWINLVLEVMRKVPYHKYLVLTKRAARMNQYFTDYVKRIGSVPENLWVGVSAENEQMAKTRVPLLIEAPVKNRFVSVEPLLERVSFMKSVSNFNKLDWVVCGAETGRNARPMDPEWARLLRYECGLFGMPFFMKQMSHNVPIPCDIDVQQFPAGLK